MILSTNWKVVYYVSSSGSIPVRDFLNAARQSVKAKALRMFLNISEYGLTSIIPHAKKLIGTSLWELRILGEDSVRIIYVTKIQKKIVLLHAFYKKTQKTPQKEISIAEKRLKEYELIEVGN